MRNGTACLIVAGMLALACFGWADEPQLADALKAAQQNKSAEAVSILSELVDKDPLLAQAYYWRGREHFRLSEMEKSLADFDKFVELQPTAESSQWERGIACYYAGKYEAGARQFELYQTYHDQDVENSVWRYLCVVPTEGVERAREKMLPITKDPRVPMMEIYDLFRGRKTVDDVFAATKAGKPSEAELKARLFYAHLYVGLYYESLGRTDSARPHILEAADKYRISHYMGDVARIHAVRLKRPVRE